MGIHTSWNKLLGAWAGQSRLILPGEPDRESPTTATGALMAKSSMCVLSYTWVFDGDPQEGQLMLSYLPDQQEVEAVFLDTWHMGPKFMLMKGRIADGDKTIVNGSYAVPESPDWGWRIVLDPNHADGWQMLMLNVSPEGESYPGFDTTVSRATP
jgi:hypothetical protein